MSAILKLIEAANAEAERLRHVVLTTEHRSTRRERERRAEQWERLAADAKIELGLGKRLA